MASEIMKEEDILFIKNYLEDTAINYSKSFSEEMFISKEEIESFKSKVIPKIERMEKMIKRKEKEFSLDKRYIKSIHANIGKIEFNLTDKKTNEQLDFYFEDLEEYQLDNYLRDRFSIEKEKPKTLEEIYDFSETTKPPIKKLPNQLFVGGRIKKEDIEINLEEVNTFNNKPKVFYTSTFNKEYGSQWVQYCAKQCDNDYIKTKKEENEALVECSLIVPHKEGKIYELNDENSYLYLLQNFTKPANKEQLRNDNSNIHGYVIDHQKIVDAGYDGFRITSEGVQNFSISKGYFEEFNPEQTLHYKKENQFKFDIFYLGVKSFQKANEIDFETKNENTRKNDKQLEF